MTVKKVGKHPILGNVESVQGSAAAPLPKQKHGAVTLINPEKFESQLQVKIEIPDETKILLEQVQKLVESFAGVTQALESVKVKAHTIEALIETTQKGHKTVQSTEKLGDVFSIAPLCNVGVQASRTVQTAPYENLKVAIMLNVPCKHVEIDEVCDFAENWVEKRLSAILEASGVPTEKTKKEKSMEDKL